jgi:hypothetical protein
MKRLCIPLIFIAFLLMPLMASADSITPDSVTRTIDVGETINITKEVTVTEEDATTKLDVFFLTDSTGSMGTAISSVKSSSSSLLSNIASLGDSAYGAGEYRDTGDIFTYRTNQDITTDQSAVQDGIDEWAASGGGDFPEANLHALEQVADTSSWRSGSERILVWFGDAPGHDPSVGTTEADATAALQDKNIRVQAISVGLNQLDSTGQATRITEATDGNLFSGIDQDAIVGAIEDAIAGEVNEYTTVGLGLSGDPSGLDILLPDEISGEFNRNEDRTFTFDLSMTGVTPGTYNFEVYGLVDGGIVATEIDSITVGDGGPAPVPEPSTMILLGSGLLGLAAFSRKKLKKTG